MYKCSNLSYRHYITYTINYIQIKYTNMRQHEKAENSYLEGKLTEKSFTIIFR